MSAPVSTVAWSCTRKRGYTSRGKAMTAKRRIARQKRETFRAYRCSFCGFWHLAHKREL